MRHVLTASISWTTYWSCTTRLTMLTMEGNEVRVRKGETERERGREREGERERGRERERERERRT